MTEIVEVQEFREGNPPPDDVPGFGWSGWLLLAVVVLLIVNKFITVRSGSFEVKR